MGMSTWPASCLPLRASPWPWNCKTCGPFESMRVSRLTVRICVAPGMGIDDSGNDRSVVDERIAVLEVELMTIGDLRLMAELGADGSLQGIAAGAELMPAVDEPRRIHGERPRLAEDRAGSAAVVRLHVAAVDLDDDGVELHRRGLRQRAGEHEAESP